MPAKRKPLPRKCPKCGSPYGTVQMVFFSGKRKNGKPSGGPVHHVIRIGRGFLLAGILISAMYLFS